MVPGFISTTEAARRLVVSKPTVRAWLQVGKLRGIREAHATRWFWQVEEESVIELLASGPSDRRPVRHPSRLQAVEGAVEALRRSVDTLLAGASPPVDGFSSAERERDHLRVRVVNLEEALARMAIAGELQREADAARATVVEHLLAALAGGEKADALRRQAADNLEEALATFSRPGHVGEAP